MHHDISAACCGLVGRQCDGELRVHDREFRAGDVVVVAALFPGRFVCDDRTVAHLAAGSCNGDDRADSEIAGTYSLNSYKGMSIQDFANMIGTTPEDASKMIQVKVKGDGTAEFISDGEAPETVSFTLDGEKVVMEAGEEKLEGTLKDGVMTLILGDEEITLVR